MMRWNSSGGYRYYRRSKPLGALIAYRPRRSGNTRAVAEQRRNTALPKNGSLRGSAWYSLNSGQQTHPVGQKRANPWGLYDMHGNVREWCSDIWGRNYPDRPLMDPSGLASGSYRVLRGGSWSSRAEFCRSTTSFQARPSLKNINTGFRVACDPSEQKAEP